ncbi:MAG: ASPIC/UnbV domain-containing protein [Pirellulaceae bacterium]|nr:ASPIC/UnbV domain-containing protein [Pirellulaceae bacterium]
MSRVSIFEAERPEENDYLNDEFTIVNSLIRSGNSWSGNERNCCFLNLGGGPFADVSTTSGFDFIDDARGVATVDWDFDGDLDVWVSNRTGPMIRFLRNNASAKNHFVSFRLVGDAVHTNRDAIGTRVELFLEGDETASQIKTLYAGSGYLSQSSKWVSFGLGEATSIARVVVAWSGGEREVFDPIASDSFHQLTQGSGQAEKWNPPKAYRPNLVPSPTKIPPPPPAARTFVSVPQVMPTLSFETQTGDMQNGVADQRPALLVLWATWCRPCLAELKELVLRAKELEAVGLRVVPICVDEVSDHAEMTRAQILEVFAQFEAPFDCGFADANLMRRLEHMSESVFEFNDQFVLPTSFLIGPGPPDILCAIYRGPINVDTVLEDVDHIISSVDVRREQATPFADRWLADPKQGELLSFADGFRDKGFVEDAVMLYRMALARDPQNVRAHEHLGALLKLHGYEAMSQQHLKAAQALKDRQGRKD